MRGERILMTVLALGLLLAFAGGIIQAQGPGPTGTSSPQAVLGTAFTYQGRLTDEGRPADGPYDFQFELYDAASDGTLLGTVTVEDVPVTDGLFTVRLDFGDAFSGEARYLAIGVRPGDSTGAYTILSPRQELTAAPYALGLRPGAVVAGTSGTILTLSGGNTGLYASGVDYGVHGRSDGTDESRGVYGYASATSGPTYGIYGESASTSGRGVYGYATADTGTTYGVFGDSDSDDGRGVYGRARVYGVYGYAGAATGTTYGVYGWTSSDSGRGVYGFAAAISGATYGVYGESASTSGRGVYGYASATTGTTYGVFGESASTSGRGVYGLAPVYGVYGYAGATGGTTYGVYGESRSPVGNGVFGLASATGGINYGVYGRSVSTAGVGVYGHAGATGGTTYGVFGHSDSTSGTGVRGLATAASGSTIGMYGQSNSPDGWGVYGYASATSGTTRGVFGRADSANGRGVYGLSPGTSGIGVYGLATATSGTTYGVFGWVNSPNGYAMYGWSTGTSAPYAGYFYGDVYVSGDFSVGGSKSFKIDHPLDPANRYLYHFAQESPEVQNVYNGVVTLDANGEAVVTLPAYFSALNTGPFRYQLTAIGAAMPNLHIAQEIQGNAFRIAGGVPGKKVSWEVTALRNDPYLRDYPARAEVDKPADEKGTYLYPQGYGQPETMGLDYRRNRNLLEHPEVTPRPAEGGE